MRDASSPNNLCLGVAEQNRFLCTTLSVQLSSTSASSSTTGSMSSDDDDDDAASAARKALKRLSKALAALPPRDEQRNALPPAARASCDVAAAFALCAALHAKHRLAGGRPCTRSCSAARR